MKGRKTFRMMVKKIMPESDVHRYTKTTYKGYPVILSPKDVASNGDILTTSYLTESGGKKSFIIAIDDIFIVAPIEVRQYALEYEVMRIKNKESQVEPKSTWAFIESVNDAFCKEYCITDDNKNDDQEEELYKAINILVHRYPIEENLKKIIDKSLMLRGRK